MWLAQISSTSSTCFTMVRNWTSSNTSDPIIKIGDVGYAFDKVQSSGQWRAKFSINSMPGQFYGVPLRVINVSQVKAGDLSIRRLAAVIQQPSLLSTTAKELTLLYALLSGFLHGTHTQMLSRLSSKLTAGIKTQSASRNTKTLCGMPQEVVPLINSNRFSLAKLWNG